ncbi:MAG TPA: toast rack family protein [Terriglobia bacterium]|nr:toast rack family protein [Terriglobia bacterium]
MDSRRHGLVLGTTRSLALWEPFLGIALAAMLSAIACENSEPVGETRTESKTVQLGAAKAVRVNLKMAAGELKVAGGASDLMNADFTYNVPRWRPEVKYDVTGGTGQLSVQQPPESGGHGGRTATNGTCA